MSPPNNASVMSESFMFHVAQASLSKVYTGTGSDGICLFNLAPSFAALHHGITTEQGGGVQMWTNSEDLQQTWLLPPSFPPV